MCLNTAEYAYSDPRMRFRSALHDQIEARICRAFDLLWQGPFSTSAPKIRRISLPCRPAFSYTKPQTTKQASKPLAVCVLVTRGPANSRALVQIVHAQLALVGASEIPRTKKIVVEQSWMRYTNVALPFMTPRTSSYYSLILMPACFLSTS